MALTMVYLGVMQNASGQIEVETEHNILTFDGTDMIDISSTLYRRLESAPSGTTNYITNTGAAESGIPFTLSLDGDIPTIGGEDADGFINDAFDFLVFNEVEDTEDNNPDDDQRQEVLSGTTIAVKLPGQLLDITGRTYRALFLAAEFQGSAIALSNTRFDSTLEITGTDAGVFNGNLSIVEKTSRSSEVQAETEVLAEQPATVSLSPNGEMSLTISDPDEANDITTMEGYLNHDGSLGVFNTIFTPGSGTPTELGVMILMET